MHTRTMRKNRMSAEERKTAILDTAVRLFSDKGFRGTTTRELAAEVGVSEPVIYQHFATKDDLYRAIIQRTYAECQRIKDPRLEAAAAAGDDLAFFTCFAELILDWYDANRNIIRLLLFCALEHHELSKPFFEQQITHSRNLIADYIRTRQKDDGLRDVEPDIAARAFIGILVHLGTVITVFQLKDISYTNDQFVAGIVDVFLNGLRTARTKAQ